MAGEWATGTAADELTSESQLIRFVAARRMDTVTPLAASPPLPPRHAASEP